MSIRVERDPRSKRIRLSRDHRMRVPDTAYRAALGLAVFSFASLEAQALRACERIAPGSTSLLAGRTAGNVADKLVDLARGLFATPDQRELLDAAFAFERLVRVRNALVHAKPARDRDGHAVLMHDGDPWTARELHEASEGFDACALRLERLNGGFLAEEWEGNAERTPWDEPAEEEGFEDERRRRD